MPATEPSGAADSSFSASAAAGFVLPVLVALPQYSNLAAQPLPYTHATALPAGTLVRVPLGQRTVFGVVWDGCAPDVPEETLVRPVLEAFTDLPALDAAWRRLIGFTARYYQRSLGEVALAALPPALRDLDVVQLQRRLRKLERSPAAIMESKQSPSVTASPSEMHRDPSEATATASPPAQHDTAGRTPEEAPRASPAAGTPPASAHQNPGAAAAHLPALTPQQQAALDAILATPQAPAPRPCLLFGATGSGKTEVYLRAVAAVLDADASAQVLVLVPEINLTPQLEQRFVARFPACRIAALHSGLTPAQRLQAWLAAHTGRARIVLGTRMAVLASIPHLRLIVVDEEHDPSYKQQEGARYSARDLAVYRARQLEARVVLGSATPSLESWHHSRPATADDAGGRYLRLSMPLRVGAAPLPAVRVVDTTPLPRGAVMAPALVAALAERIARGEQSLVLLNRRGYAPVLHCGDCGWKSECPHCSAYRVFHRIDRTLRCHHCGFTERVPRACPACGNQDLRTLGQGTERLEEALREQLGALCRPDGSPVTVTRIDADTTRRAGSLHEQLARVHTGSVDVLVGTQMVAKGHDFRRITLVAALNADSALFSSDFRAPERLFSLLMQAGGRAGRDAAIGGHSELWVQTQFPRHPLFAALARHDYAGFAAQQLHERAAANLPPFSHQALVRAEGRDQNAVQEWLNALAVELRAGSDAQDVFCYPAVPMTPQRVANRERAQMLLESSDRPALQRLLPRATQWLHARRTRAILRWAIDVDPLAI